MNKYIGQMRRPVFSGISRATAALFLTLAVAACGGGGGENNALATMAGLPTATATATKDITCLDYNYNPVTLKPKTITIYNNSDRTIYPAISAGKNPVNQWIQGCLRKTDNFPTDFVYKLYVNEGAGIPPNSSVLVTLPLYSTTSDNKYITWWNGGRVLMADKTDRMREAKDTPLSTPDDVSCKGTGTACSLTTYSSDVDFAENIYAQLSEFTFGDSVEITGQKERLLKPENVGYNISYVDHVYMPVAIGPKDNPYIGYSGSTESLKAFTGHLDSFLRSSTGSGWPVYNLSSLKLPGGYNIFAQRPGTLPPDANVPVKPLPNDFPPVLTTLKCIEGGCTNDEKKNLHYGDAVQRIQDLWGSCVDWSDTGEDLVAKGYVAPQATCDRNSDLAKKLAVIKGFYSENYKTYAGLACRDKAKTFTFLNVLQHIYGWVPFNEGCGSGDNALLQTTYTDSSGKKWDHASAQSMYIHDLQYNYKQGVPDNQLFNPYVQLIHGPTENGYLNMSAYGFSVDDAVGFMSELGSGLVFAVGSNSGLENKLQFNYQNGFNVNLGVPPSLKNDQVTPLIKKYGVCVLNEPGSNDPTCQKDKQDVTMPTTSLIAGFRVGSVSGYPIKVRFTDTQDNLYTFNVNAQFVRNCANGICPSGPPANAAQVFDPASCSITTPSGQKHPQSDGWCHPTPYQQPAKAEQVTQFALLFNPPVDMK